jgi:hypothetical protein
MRFINWRRVLIVVLVLFSQSRHSIANDAKDVEQFLAAQEQAARAVQKKLMLAIENQAKEVRRSNLSPGEKQIRLDAIELDRAALESEGKLPSSDEMLEAVIRVVEDYQKVIRNLESFRQRHSDQTLRQNNRDASAKLDALEARLNKIVGGRDTFASGSKWSGEFSKHGLGRRGKKVRDQSFRMELSVNESQGNEFRGVLSQTGNVGRAAKMDVVGNLDGNQIFVHITDVTRGKERSLELQGYLLSDRIIANVKGIDVNRNPTTGWVSLWHENDKEPAKRRRKKSGL